ncbi:MAG TPA: hypothetical protein VHK88_17345, partial [Aquihabitans sp.]|nr:hypothetical protein [Aquihabitans sp.]
QSGKDAIDGALEDPPGEDVLFNPLLHDTDEGKSELLDVAAPKGAEVIDDGEFGATAWYLMLASRMEPKVALRATDGLSGDGYVVYRDEKRVCVRASATGEAESDVEELRAALADWSGRSPEGTASVEVADGTVEFRSCDPGADAPAVGEVAVDLLALPVTRTQLYNQVLASGGTDAQGRCFGQTLIDRFSFEQFTDEAFLSGPEGQGLIGEVQRSCL